jgi:hypothetical protein
MSIPPEELAGLLLAQVAETGEAIAAQFEAAEAGQSFTEQEVELVELDHLVAIQAVDVFIVDNPDFDHLIP